MLRIRTMIGTTKVYTLMASYVRPHQALWTTFISRPNKPTTWIDASSLQEAGINHLNACQQAKQEMEHA